MRSRSKVFSLSTITKVTRMISADSFTDITICPVKRMPMFPASSLREWASGRATTSRVLLVPREVRTDTLRSRE